MKILHEVNDFPVPMFVYGTLRRGHGLNWCLRDSEFIKKTRTKSEFNMFGAGCPIIVRNGETAITGELYLVCEEDFRTVDNIEVGAGYNREWVELEDGEEAIAYTYALDGCGNLIISGDWTQQNTPEELSMEMGA